MPPTPNSRSVELRVDQLFIRWLRLALLDLGASDFGRLLGVSAQSIYNWEAEKARPRVEQISKLVPLRSLGKREVAVRLEQLKG